MSNTNSPFGLRLIKEVLPGKLEMCLVASGVTVPIGKGDAIKTAGSAGNIGNNSTVKTVTRIAAGDAIYGVVVGTQPQFVTSGMNLQITHRPASTDMYVLVRRANNQDEYAIQCDDEGSTLAVTDVGLNANLTGNGGGTTITDCNTQTGMSTMELDTSTKNTTATLQLKISGFLDDPSNEIGVANQKARVMLNNVEASGGTGTAGV